MFAVYLPEYNPSGLTGTVGGDISSTRYSGSWSECLKEADAPPSGEAGLVQYRKLYIKNEGPTNKTQVRVWLDHVEHPDQISLALASGTDTLDSPTGQLSGYTFTQPTSKVNGLSLGDLNANSYTGIWIKETLSGISTSDNYASFRLVMGGI